MLGARIDDHGRAGPMAGVDNRPAHALGHDALGVVRDDDDPYSVELVQERVDDLGFSGAAHRSGLLVVEAQKLLLLADHAHFADSRPPVGDRAHLDTVRRRVVRQAATGFVSPDHADQHDAPAKRRHVCGGVGGPPHHQAGAGDPQHRHRCFRRETRAVSGKILVGDDVADDQDLLAGEPCGEIGGETGSTHAGLRARFWCTRRYRGKK